jgi:prepilin-type N-terminal cleavage/methylation domain-containing protein/prepilin-type processing-associated H-X9-DG protein
MNSSRLVRRRLFAVGHEPVRSRGGFTLVELLVVIAIIGVLVSLMLPAVFSAVDAARRMKCLNNMKQITTAMLNNENNLKQLPMCWGQVSTPGQATASYNFATQPQTSWMSMILPYIEEGPLYSMMAIGSTMGTGSQYGQVVNNATAAQTVIKTFLCPSDYQVPQTGIVSNVMFGTNLFGATNYKAVNGCNWTKNVDPTSTLSGTTVGNTTTVDPVTNQSAVAWPTGRNAGSSDGLEHSNGIMCRNGGGSSGASPLTITVIADIRDGTSKTFALGESVVLWCNWNAWYWCDGCTATCGIPLNYKVPGVLRDANAGDWTTTYSFMSRHKGGANFMMCDGSGSFVSDFIDLTIYRSLATIDGASLNVAATGELPNYNNLP